MNSAKSPRLAVWLLEHFGPELNREALAGDLNEAMAQGRSSGWYWRQVLAAVGWRRVLYKPLILVAWSWVVTLPGTSGNSPVASRLLVMAVLMAAFLAFRFVHGMVRDKGVLRAVVIVIFFLVFPLSGIVVFFIWNFAFPRKAQGPYPLTVRELVFGDPNTERQRLLEKLHVAMLQETNPELRHTYAEAIAVLQRNETPAAKATE